MGMDGVDCLVSKWQIPVLQCVGQVNGEPDEERVQVSGDGSEQRTWVNRWPGD